MPRRTATKVASAPNDVKTVTIAPPNFGLAEFMIVGTRPLVQHRFGKKAIDTMVDRQRQGSRAAKGTKREPRDFERDFQEAQHVSTEGWHGIPASSFRAAMISACRLCGFVMTKAKLAVFVEPDGVDRQDATPLVRLIAGEPTMHVMPARNDDQSTDIRCRAMWPVGWQAVVRVRFDADLFSEADIANLIARAGLQVGVQEGRPDSPRSNGMDWGLWSVEGPR